MEGRKGKGEEKIAKEEKGKGSRKEWKEKWREQEREGEKKEVEEEEGEEEKRGWEGRKGKRIGHKENTKKYIKVYSKLNDCILKMKQLKSYYYNIFKFVNNLQWL